MISRSGPWSRWVRSDLVRSPCHRPAVADDQSSGGDDGGEAPASPAPPSNDGGGDSSGTNNQEAGVDEADIAKVQGTRLVAVNGGTLRVIDAAGGTPVLLGSLGLGGNGDHRLLLDGDRLAGAQHHLRRATRGGALSRVHR